MLNFNTDDNLSSKYLFCFLHDSPEMRSQKPSSVDVIFSRATEIFHGFRCAGPATKRAAAECLRQREFIFPQHEAESLLLGCDGVTFIL